MGGLLGDPPFELPLGSFILVGFGPFLVLIGFLAVFFRFLFQKTPSKKTPKMAKSYQMALLTSLIYNYLAELLFLHLGSFFQFSAPFLWRVIRFLTFSEKKGVFFSSKSATSRIELFAPPQKKIELTL